MIDIGINLTNKRFDKDRDQVLERALKAGVEMMLVTGTDFTSNQQALDLAMTYPHCLRSTAGLHPHYASELNHEVLQQIREMASQDLNCAVGECGLDFNRNFSTPAQQEKAFECLLEIASEMNKPLFLHERDAFERFAPMLKGADLNAPSVVHCFTGSREALRTYLDMGCYIGITGWVCDERRGTELQSLVPYIPDDRLLIETDAPYLLPRSLPEKPRNGRNEPAFLPHIAETLAQLRKTTCEQIIKITRENSLACFRLQPL